MDNYSTKKAALKEVLIYTDGACSGNPGPGGWGALLFYQGKRKELSGYEAQTTNNRMELTAAIEALSALKIPCSVKLYSDSAYLIDAFKKNWLPIWQNNSWLTKDKKAVKNIDLWQKLAALCRIHRVDFFKVKGHSDNEFNNYCDKLATGQIKLNQLS